MSQYALPDGQDQPTPAGTSTTHAAREQAGAVAGDVKAQGQQVAGHAAQETRQVVDQAKNELSDLLWRSRAELSQQATGQQQRLAAGLRSLGEEIDEMTNGSARRGLAGQTAAQLSGRITEAADFLEQRDFHGVLDELSSFARRRPGAFLFGAALLGVVAGRVTRGLQSGSADDSMSVPRPAGADAGLVEVPAPRSTVSGLTTDAQVYPAYPGLDEPVEGFAGTPAGAPAHSAYIELDEPREQEYTTTAEVTAPPPSGWPSTEDDRDYEAERGR